MNVHMRRFTLLVLFSALLVMIVQTGCDELVTEQVTVIEAGHPIAEFDVDSGIGCAPHTVQFIDESNGPRHVYVWDFGEDSILQETIPPDSNIPYESPTYTYDTAGIYTVKLTIRDTINDGIDTRVKQRFIYVGATSAEFTADPDTGCPGTEVLFYPAEYSDVKTYSWDFGDGGTSEEANPRHTFMGVGTYDVMLATDDGCGYDTVFTQIEIVPCPTVAIVADSTSGCIADGAELEIQFHDASDGNGSNIVEWNWRFDGGNPLFAYDADPIVTYDQGGYKTVVLEVKNEMEGVSVDTFENFITAYDLPTAIFTVENAAACYSPFRQFLVRFTDNSTGPPETFLWDFGDGTTDTVQNPIHAYTEPGYYTVTLTVENPCGINVWDLPNAVTVSDQLLDENTFIETTNDGVGEIGSTWTFTDTTTALVVFSREWSVNDDAIAGETGLVFDTAFDVEGTYEIKLTLTNDCGQAVAYDTIEVIGL